MATLQDPTEEGLALAGARIREGSLVAFPTETVYGLGGNALNEAALRLIFTTKGRPLTDPLIVHVHSLEQALSLVQVEGQDRQMFEALAKAFWPGPLTLISRAVSSLPSVVTAGTGFVGVRMPAHPLAQRLIKAAEVPIAAPSANRFGHVSPTTATHVMHDLGHCAHVLVINGESASASSPASTSGCLRSSCEIGIESTVAKLVTGPQGCEVWVLRRGAVTEAHIGDTLATHGMPHVRVRVLNRADAEEVTQEAPGQLITHYAPDVPTFLLTGALASRSTAPCEDVPAGLVVVDFAGRLAPLQGCCLAYQDLSPLGEVKEASRRLFEMLRWAELVPGVKVVVLAEVTECKGGQSEGEGGGQQGLAAGVMDRMTRAASGRVLAVGADGSLPALPL